MCLNQSGFEAGLTVWNSTCFFVMKWHVVLGCEFLDCLNKTHALNLANEGKNIAALLTAKAMEIAALWGDVKRRRPLVMKRAQALEAAAAGRFEVDIVANDIVNPSAFPHQVDVCFTNSAHGAIVGVMCD